MASYGTIADVTELLAQFTIGASTKPTTTQATNILTDVSNEIDVTLSGAGVSVPVASPAYFTEWLGRLNAYGTAAAVLKSMFPDETGAGETPAYAFWETRYQNGLRGIRDGSLLPGDIVSGTNIVLPSTYLTNYPEENAEIGANAEPMFSTSKVF